MYPTPAADFFHWIAHIFEDFLLVPLGYLRHLQDQTWWGANLINWVFIAIFFVLFFYWLHKLKVFADHDKKHTPETHR